MSVAKVSEISCTSTKGFDEAIHEFTNSKAILYSLATEKTSWPE